MVTVRQSIIALYEEAQKSAVESAPMLTVLQSDAACPDALPARADMNKTIPLPATAIATRFEELRRLAELEANAIPSKLPAGNDAAGIPIIDILSTEFGAAPENTVEPIAEQPRNATPPSQAVTGIESGPSLPEEPPAPASDNTGDKLNIADIHTLVREAWEDETDLGGIASPKAGEQTASHHAEAADIAANGNIETAMQEIAAAVVQSADSEQGIDVETIKSEIIAAMRAELQAIVGSDLKSVIKTAVAEAMADMPAEAPPAGQANPPPLKVAPKTTAKKAAKAAAKTKPKKSAAKKKRPTAGLSRIATADLPRYRGCFFQHANDFLTCPIVSLT